MISDPNLNLSIARSRIALMQAEAASQRLARGTDRTARSGDAAHGSIVAALVAMARRLASATTAVASRRHPAGKAA